MTAQLNLKEIEKRAFRSTYQDGLWDIYYGLIVILMAVFIYRPESGYSLLNIFLMITGFLLSYALFWAGKKFITKPRLGQAKFGEIRKQKRKTMGLVLGAFVLCQSILIGITSFGWLNPEFGEKLNLFLGEHNRGLMVVSLIGSLMVGSAMIVSAFFSDFTRGYYIAILMALAVFLMVFLNRPIMPVLIGTIIILPGIVLLIRFIRSHPIPLREHSNE